MRVFYKHNVASTRVDQSGATQALTYGRQTLAITQLPLLPACLVANNSLNTPTAIASSGKMATTAYTPFGFARHEHQASVGFNGDPCDPLTGNYGLGQGYRWYSPALRRFQAADDISPFGLGGVNSYAFTHNDPVNKNDPDGHQERKYFRNLSLIKPNPAEGKRLGFFRSQPRQGKPSLFVHLHSDKEAVSFQGVDYNPKQFIELLGKLNISLGDYKKLIFTSCYAGNTFAPEVARAIQITVMAPSGILTAAVDFNKKSDTYNLSYLSKPQAGFFPQDQLAPPEDYVFGLMKFVPVQHMSHTIRGFAETGR
ncbi:RHS repeat-associated core domain-containing protein [Pseudomonas sp. NPDC008258]|uniref:RHS repeat-associated core domain-containing protein n=1 Tax=Pseudomonas sp. NPDC008258 TaxID=3364418 RepID=UPI0036EBC5ED